MSDETDAFGRPLRPEGTDPFGAPIEQGTQAPTGWAPPAAPPDETVAAWKPPVSPIGPEGELSGWWRRVGASVIDGLVVGVVGAMIGALVSSAVDATGDETTAITAFLGIVLATAYYGVLMSRPGADNGRTLGKQATGIRVVRVDGQPITFGFALVREVLVKMILLGYIAFVTLYIATLLNYLWPLWDPQNRALHDRMVRTLVRRV